MHEMVELSRRNPYYISKHRYLELKNFCLQYKEWKQACRDIDERGLRSNYILSVSKTPFNTILGSDVERTALSKQYYSEKIQDIVDAAERTDSFLAHYIIKAVTEGRSWVYMSTKINIPCSRYEYYKLYRKFFWLLDKARR